MIKYAKVINQDTKEVAIYEGNSEEYIKLYGVSQQEVEQSYNGHWYLKGYAPVKPAPTVQEKVKAKEAQTGLTRAMRELVLAENSGASDYVKQQAQEIETLAAPLREASNE